jgi:tetratricopeptide (TPR) repeat protein
VALPDVRASFLSARRADVTGGVLRRGDLSCADLRGASLSGADLRHADLSGADLRGTVMSRADLRGARLVGARLERADLTGAVVAGADLRAADLRGAYLTNVDLAATRMDGARVRAEDLAPAETRPDPTTRALRVEPVGVGGAYVDALALVAPAELRRLAVATAARLRARRAGLERVNGDLDAIHLREETPYAGEAADHGLPGSVAVRRRPPRWRTRAWAELRPVGAGDGVSGGDESVQVVVHLPGRGALAAGRVAWPNGDARDDGDGAERLASAIQAQLADPEVFADTDELRAFAAWLERPESSPDAMLAEVLGRNPRNPVALLMRAFARESSDVHDMTEASDEVRAAWAVSSSDTARALAAARLAWAQGQVLFRASDSAAVLARARSAADTALRLFDRLEVSRGTSPRLLVLRTKAELAWALSRSVTERPDDLTAGIARVRRSVHALERRGLAGTPRLRNALAYWLMTLAGRFTPGPGAGYTEAVEQLRQLLAHYSLREEMDLVDDANRRTTVSVRTLARRAAAGKGPPADRLLWERSLRLGLVNLGNLHRLEKRFDAALDCYGAAIYCSPDYVEAYAERAWVHLERADRVAADADIRRALERDVGTPQQKARILVGYVEALERVGLELEQGPWLEEVRQRDPENVRLEALAHRWEERFGDRA